jgi:hypothetical protein
MDSIGLFYCVAFSAVAAIAVAGMALDWIIYGSPGNE